ncbi:MAG: hypothetical protein JKX84_02935 [Flavobacteriales bacterium]|nr:hypothetical protein [Flavobacteriales bacterium]
MKTKISLSVLLIGLFSLNALAQKKNYSVIKPTSLPTINGSKAPKKNVNGSMVRPVQSANTQKIQNTDFRKKGNSFFVSLENVSVEGVIAIIKQNFSLSDKHTYISTRETTDDLGITHYSFAQYYNGVRLNEGMILLHGKNGTVSSANGQVAAFESLNTAPSITKERANELAIDFMAAKEYLKTDYEIELLVAKD